MKRFEIFSKGTQVDTLTTLNLPQYGIDSGLIEANSSDEALCIYKGMEDYQNSIKAGFSEHIALEVNSNEYNNFIKTHYIVDDTLYDLINKGLHIPFQDIHFSELTNYNDSNSLVFISTKFKCELTELDEIDTLLHDNDLIPIGKCLIDYRFITGNVKGDARTGADSRSDYLLVFSPDLDINPIVRFMIKDLMWTSDFIDNYKTDYKNE